jgi:hypothetical protein
VIEKKVTAGSAGATAAGLIDWALAEWLFPHMHDPAGRAMILAAVPGAIALIAGYLAPHTSRPAAAPQQLGKASGVTVIPPSTGPATDPPAPGGTT